MKIFGLPTARVKIHQTPPFIFQTKSFSSKIGTFLNVMTRNYSVLLWLKHNILSTIMGYIRYECSNNTQRIIKVSRKKKKLRILVFLMLEFEIFPAFQISTREPFIMQGFMQKQKHLCFLAKIVLFGCFGALKKLLSYLKSTKFCAKKKILTFYTKNAQKFQISSLEFV